MMTNVWHDPKSRFWTLERSLRITLDTLHALIPFEIACCGAGATYADFSYWFDRARELGLITKDENAELKLRIDCAMYRRTMGK